MTKILNLTKKIALGLILTLVGGIPAAQVWAHGPGGPDVEKSYGIPLRYTWKPAELDILDKALNIATDIGEKTALIAQEVGEYAYGAARYGVSAAYTGASLVKKASLFTYMLAQKGWSATKRTAKKGCALYCWATNQAYEEEQPEIVAPDTLTVGPAYFV